MITTAIIYLFNYYNEKVFIGKPPLLKYFLLWFTTFTTTERECQTDWPLPGPITPTPHCLLSKDQVWKVFEFNR